MNTQPTREHTDELVRQIMRATDPLQGQRAGRVPLSAAQIRAQVEASVRYRARTRVRRLLRRPVGEHYPEARKMRLIVALPLVMASIVAVMFGVRAITREQMAAAIDSPSGPGQLDYDHSGLALPARSYLRELAGEVVALDSPPSAGKYTHVRMQTWPADASTGPTAQRLVAHDLQVWWAADRSGHERRTTLPPQPEGLRVAGWLGVLPQSAAVERTEYAPGEYAVAVDNPSPLPPVLAGQLAHHQNGTSPEKIVRAVADMYRYQCLNPAQRAAALQVLADTDNLVYRGWVTDRAGRKGVAISVDSGATDSGLFRDLLVLDPRTGAVLSHERVVLTNPPRTHTRVPAVMSYVLYLACSHTDQRP